MPVQDKTIVVKGSEASVSSVQMYPLPDGSVTIVVSGSSKDASGNSVSLSEAKLTAKGVAVLDNLMARALTELRKANGLE